MIENELIKPTIHDENDTSSPERTVVPETIYAAGRVGLEGAEPTQAAERDESVDDNLQPLLPLLKGPDSIHKHKYDDSTTVYTKAREAKGIEDYHRTDMQRQLLRDMETLRNYAPLSSAYEDVYTPQELRALVAMLELLGQKNRPDFDDVEGKILDVILDNTRTGYVDSTVAGTAKRAQENRDNRRGMQWSTLTKYAGIATAILRGEIINKPDKLSYLVDIERDPQASKTLDLTNVYSFVAACHAFDVMGQRSASVQDARKQIFLNNYSIVETWFERAQPVLASLPEGFIGERLGAQWEVESLVRAMQARRSGDARFGREKHFSLDPAGAICLQLKLGHTVDTIRENLAKGINPKDAEIVPLEIEEL